jgi:hypothetical protein
MESHRAPALRLALGIRLDRPAPHPHPAPTTVGHHLTTQPRTKDSPADPGSSETENVLSERCTDIHTAHVRL